MRISEQQVMRLLSILDGTLTNNYLSNVFIGGYSPRQREALLKELRDQQSEDLIDLEHGGRVQAM